MTKGLTQVLGVVVVLVAALAVQPANAAGPEWIEISDAGPTLPTSQFTFGIGRLGRISGTLSSAAQGGDFEDVFAIRIVDPTIFQAIVDPGQTDFDVRLALFDDPGGFGVLAAGRDSDPAGAVMPNSATDGSGAMVATPGVYYLAISGEEPLLEGVGGREPQSMTGQIFDFVMNTEVSGPDGVGGADPLTNWVGLGQTGVYSVQLVGCEFAEEVPPKVPVRSGWGMASTAVLLVIVGVVFVRRL